MPSYSTGLAVARTWNGGSERERLALDGDLAFLHRFQQGGLCLRRRAVDLVGQQQTGEQRTTTEHELVHPLIENERAGEVGRQQIGRELGAGEPQPERLGERTRGKRLSEARQILEQHVTTGEDAAQDERERLALAHDGPVHLVENVASQARRRPDVDRLRAVVPSFTATRYR